MKNKALSLMVMALLGPGLGAQEAPIPHGCSVTPAELQADLQCVAKPRHRVPRPLLDNPAPIAKVRVRLLCSQ